MRSSDFPGIVDRLVTSFPKRKYARGGEVRSEDREQSEQNLTESQHAGVAPKGFDIRNTWDRASQYYDISGIMRDPTKKQRKYWDGGDVDADPADSPGSFAGAMPGGGGIAGGDFNWNMPDTSFLTDTNWNDPATYGLDANWGYGSGAGGDPSSGGTWVGSGEDGHWEYSTPNYDYSVPEPAPSYNPPAAEQSYNYDYSVPDAYNPPAAEQNYDTNYDVPAGPTSPPAAEQNFDSNYDVPAGPTSPPAAEFDYGAYSVPNLGLYSPEIPTSVPQGYGFSNINPAAMAAAMTPDEMQAPASVRDIMNPGYGFSAMTTDPRAVPTGGTTFFDTPLGQTALANDMRREKNYSFANDPLSEVVPFDDMSRYMADRIMEQGKQYGVNVSPTGAAAMVARSLAESPKFGLDHSSLKDEKGRSAYGLNQARGARQENIKAWEAANPQNDRFTNQIDYITKEYLDPMSSIKHGLLGNYEKGVAALQGDDPYAADRATIAYERPENYAGWNTPLDSLGIHPGGYRATADRAYNSVAAAMAAGAAVDDFTTPTASVQSPLSYTQPAPEPYRGWNQEEFDRQNSPSKTMPDISGMMNSLRTPEETGTNMLGYDTTSPAKVMPDSMNGIPTSSNQGYFSTAGWVSGPPGMTENNSSNLMGLASSPTNFTGNSANDQLQAAVSPAAVEKAKEIYGPNLPTTVPEVKQLIDPKNIAGPLINAAINLTGIPGLIATLASYGITGQSPGYALLDALEKITGGKLTAGVPNEGFNEGSDNNDGLGSRSEKMLANAAAMGSSPLASASPAPATPAPTPTPSAPVPVTGSPANSSWSRERNGAPDYARYGFGPAHSFFR